jgi:Na+-transporting NADH:ubiquinone oxidoreductase subunit NqrB
MGKLISMKTKFPFLLFFLYVNLLFLSSCGVVETIFKAGMWWAFFLVGLVVILILWVVFRARKK